MEMENSRTTTNLIFVDLVSHFFKKSQSGTFVQICWQIKPVIYIGKLN